MKPTKSRGTPRIAVVVLPLLTLLSTLSEPASAAEKTTTAEEPVTERAVEHAIEEYVRAKYAGDAETVQSRAHPALARRAVSDIYWGQPSDEWVRLYTHEMLRFYGTPFNHARLDDPGEGRCDITVFDIEERTASCVVVMDDVVDYLHMIHFDGRWVIADSAVIILDEPGATPPEPTDTDLGEIERLSHDYCVGFYELDGDKVQATCHPSLSKRVVEVPEQISFDYLRGITYEEIRILGESFNKEFGFDPETARVEVEVYEIRDNIAAAKMTGTIWFDYFHLMRVNDEWSIVNIMFEPLSEDRWAGVPEQTGRG